MPNKEENIKQNRSRKRAVTAITFYVTSAEKEMLLGDAKLYGGTSNCIRLQLGLSLNATGRKLKNLPGEIAPLFDFD